MWICCKNGSYVFFFVYTEGAKRGWNTGVQFKVKYLVRILLFICKAFRVIFRNTQVVMNQM